MPNFPQYVVVNFICSMSVYWITKINETPTKLHITLLFTLLHVQVSTLLGLPQGDSCIIHKTSLQLSVVEASILLYSFIADVLCMM